MVDKQEETKKSNLQADNNGIAIGSIDVGGDANGNITIGHTVDEVSVLIAQISSTSTP